MTGMLFNVREKHCPYVKSEASRGSCLRPFGYYQAQIFSSMWVIIGFFPTILAAQMSVAFGHLEHRAFAQIFGNSPMAITWRCPSSNPDMNL